MTDGLRRAREQGITIDVAYRYFSTPLRSFVIADTPGHVQYTRNMVTGASTSDVAVILVDARHGLREQSRRHAALSALLGIQHLVLAVNKMDLVDWSEARFEEIRDEFAGFAEQLQVPVVTAIPLCALDGGNVVDPRRTPRGTRGRPCSSTSEDARHPDARPRRAAPAGTGGDQARRGQRCGPHWVSDGGTPARSPVVCRRSVTRSSCCHRAPRSRIAAVEGNAGGTRSWSTSWTCRAATSSCRPTMRRSPSRSSPLGWRGWGRSRCAQATTCS
ncbi:MAG: GTP-binding protein [Ilumatobacteraceae bacterium]